MTQREAIIRILEKHGQPLHYTVICQRAIRRGWLQSSSANPDVVVCAILCQGLRSQDGDFFRVNRGIYALRIWMRKRLRRLVRRRVRHQGFVLKLNGTVLHNDQLAKDAIRQFHRQARQVKLKKNAHFLEMNAETLVAYFADGSQVSVPDFRPRLVEVKSETVAADLFRFGTLLWSAPVSEGFGRRLRFVVIDDHNGKLVGLFALGDPVFNQRTRDDWIGWDHRQRQERLYNVMDIFTLGAVPPYNDLLCGKLIALLAASNEVRETVRRKYADATTIIEKANKDSRLVLLTTSSALGRSSLYNRVTMSGRLVYERIGLTEGWGHFHLSDGIFGAMKKYLHGIGDPIVSAHQYGSGPNWRIRLARTCLDELGMSQDLLRHGIKRELYMVPLARDFKTFLLGKDKKPDYYDMPMEDIVNYFKERWMSGRALRRPTHREHNHLSVLELIQAARNPNSLHSG